MSERESAVEHPEADGREAVARAVLAVLRADCPGSRADLRGSLAAGAADAYSDIDVRWTVPAERFGACVDGVAELLRRVRPLRSLRGDPEFAETGGRRLIFAAFAGLPLFWRLDLDVRAEPAAAATRPAVAHPWPPAASALANAVAAVKMLGRGRPDAARELLERAMPRVGAAPGVTGRWLSDVLALTEAAGVYDSTQLRLAEDVAALARRHLSD